MKTGVSGIVKLEKEEPEYQRSRMLIACPKSEDLKVDALEFYPDLILGFWLLEKDIEILPFGF